MNWHKQSDTSQVDVAPDVVVQDYLDFMLRSATKAVETPKPVVVPIAEKSKVLSKEAVITKPPELKTELDVEAPATTALEEPLSVELAEPVSQQTPEPSATKPRQSNNSKPHWAEEPFECLMFQVLGLKLGAALVELGGIARIDDDLKPVFGQSNWFMGLLRWNGRNIKVIDTARLIMPERLEGRPENEHPNYEFVLMIEGTDWGLGIDSASESVHLNPNEVRWRVSKQTRPWLAGTALERMCAILDLATVSAQLEENERPEK